MLQCEQGPSYNLFASDNLGGPGLSLAAVRNGVAIALPQVDDVSLGCQAGAGAAHRIGSDDIYWACYFLNSPDNVFVYGTTLSSTDSAVLLGTVPVPGDSSSMQSSTGWGAPGLTLPLLFSLPHADVFYLNIQSYQNFQLITSVWTYRYWLTSGKRAQAIAACPNPS
jgi:hypothetical protein